MFTTSTTCTTLLTPYDQGAEDLLGQLLSGATQSIHFSVYSATLPVFYDGLIDAHKRGVAIKGVFDLSQSKGPAEVKQLHRLWTTVPPDLFRIGTSPIGHNILHLKSVVIDAPEPGKEPAGKQYEHWQDALADGYPIVFSGSWNLSQTASKQANNIDIMPGILRAQAFAKAIEDLFDWIDKNEEQPAA